MVVLMYKRLEKTRIILCILMQIPLVNVSRLRGFTQSISQYFVAESSAPQTEAGSSVWVCCACKARPVVAVRSKCGHLFCHVCSIRQRSVSTPSSLIFILTKQGESKGGWGYHGTIFLMQLDGCEVKASLFDSFKGIMNDQYFALNLIKWLPRARVCREVVW